MNARSILVAAVAATLVSPAALLACASDEAAPPAEPEPNRVPPSDAAIEDASSDGGEGAAKDKCTPDALCPNGPFGPYGAGPGVDPRTRINVIRGRSTEDVWAAGAHGVIAHFDGALWDQSKTDTIETIKGLWLRDSGELAFASLVSPLARGLTIPDGGPPSAGGWVASPEPPGPPEMSYSSRRLTSMWAAPRAEWLWSTTLEFEAFIPELEPVNGLWRLRVNPSSGGLEIGDGLPPGMCQLLHCKELMGIHGASPDALWAVGLTGQTVHVTEAQGGAPKAKAFDSRTWAALNAVWAASDDDVWAVGGGGVIRHYTGHPTTWEIVSDVPATEDLRGVWGSSSTDIWAVGDGAVVLHYDGKSWSRVRVAGLGARRPDLFTVWVPAPGHVWAGGDGVILSLGGKP